MRIVFLGSTQLGYATLEALLASDHTVALVVTHPKQTQPNFYDRLWEAPVDQLAADHGVEFREQLSVNDDDSVRLIREADPEILVSADWRSWVSSSVTGLPSHGAINIHEALLPRFAGCAPLNWAIAAGEPAVGATTHFMVDEMDMGDIILQEKVPVAEDETTTDVFPRVRDLFPKLVLRTIELIEENSVVAQPQDRSSATYFHKRALQDSQIDWRLSNRDVYNLIRAQSDPYPNAYTFLGNERIRIKRARFGHAKYRGTPGRICARAPDGVVVLCGPVDSSGGQALVLTEVELDDGGPVPASSVFTRIGAQLTDAPAEGA